MVLSIFYKLRIMGVTIDGEYNVFSGNEAVWKGCSRLEVTLNNKHFTIYFNYVCGVVVSWIMHVGCVKGGNNLFGCLTKLMSRMKKRSLCGNFL